MKMSPPRPPSPPEGPPRGTYFSRRNARQPLPPSPALTRIRASSMNTALGRRGFRRLDRFDADELAHPAAVPELHAPGHLGEQRIVFAPAHVDAGLDGCAALPH